MILIGAGFFGLRKLQCDLWRKLKERLQAAKEQACVGKAACKQDWHGLNQKGMISCSQPELYLQIFTKLWPETHMSSACAAAARGIS